MTQTNRLAPVGFNPSNAAQALKLRGLGAMLLTSPENVFYTTGYTALPSAGNPILYMLRNRLPFASVVADTGKVTLLCWGFSTWDMEFGVDEVIGFNDRTEALKAISGAVAGNGPLGIETTCPYAIVHAVGGAAGSRELAVVDDLLDELRLRKSPTELALLKKSLEIAEETCKELHDVLRIGMRRSELTREAKYRLIRNGAEGISHITFSFSGANPEFDSEEELLPGRLVTLDLGAIYRGYCSDNRRYAYTGTVTQEIADLHGAMVEIVDGVGNALVPGARYPDLMALGRDLYRKFGLQPLGRFNHVGHNIGLETEEQWLDDNEGQVAAGMAINIELYTIASTGEQIGNEETYFIDADGPNRISKLSRDIHEVR